MSKHVDTFAGAGVTYLGAMAKNLLIDFEGEVATPQATQQPSMSTGEVAERIEWMEAELHQLKLLHMQSEGVDSGYSSSQRTSQVVHVGDSVGSNPSNLPAPAPSGRPTPRPRSRFQSTPVSPGLDVTEKPSSLLDTRCGGNQEWEGKGFYLPTTGRWWFSPSTRCRAEHGRV